MEDSPAGTGRLCHSALGQGITHSLPPPPAFLLGYKPERLIWLVLEKEHTEQLVTIWVDVPPPLHSTAIILRQGFLCGPN